MENSSVLQGEKSSEDSSIRKNDSKGYTKLQDLEGKYSISDNSEYKLIRKELMLLFPGILSVNDFLIKLSGFYTSNETPNNVVVILNKYNTTLKFFLERYYVGKRVKAKKINDIVENNKLSVHTILENSNEEKIELGAKSLKQKSTRVRSQLNPILLEGQKLLNKRRSEKTKKRLKTFNINDEELLINSVDEALKRYGKERLSICDGLKSMKQFLVTQFPGMARMHTKSAIIKFKKLYYNKYNELYPEKKTIIQENNDFDGFPNDRNGVGFTFIFNDGEREICKIRGEKCIIKIVKDYLEKSGVDFSTIITKKEKIEFGDDFQRLIDIYYTIKRDFQVLSYSESCTQDWIILDIEELNLRLKTIRLETVLLGPQKIHDILINKVIKNYEIKKKLNPITAMNSKENKPIEFDGLRSFFKVYGRLQEKINKKNEELGLKNNKNHRKDLKRGNEYPKILEVLTDLGFNNSDKMGITKGLNINIRKKEK